MLSDCEQYGPNEDHQYDGGGGGGGGGEVPLSQYVPPPPPAYEAGVMGYEPGMGYEQDSVYETDQMCLPPPQHYPTLSLCATYPPNFSTQVLSYILLSFFSAVI